MCMGHDHKLETIYISSNQLVIMSHMQTRLRELVAGIYTRNGVRVPVGYVMCAVRKTA